MRASIWKTGGGDIGLFGRRRMTDLFLRRTSQRVRVMMRHARARPPTTPPTMAPHFVEGGALGDKVVDGDGEGEGGNGLDVSF